MAFNFEQRFDRPEDDTRDIAKLEGEDVRKILTTWETNLHDLIAGGQFRKLERHGFVVLLNGSWGSGKTTAVRALLKGVDEKCGKKRDLLFIEYSFLPFGNVNESIADFINELAGQLWQTNWLDMRKEVKCLIASATPADDTKYTLGLNTGLFTASIERKWHKQTFIGSEHKLYERFNTLTAKKRTVIVTIDDIDRLEPDETVAILRLIEKLRKLPNLLIVVPVHKTIVSNAVQEHLKLPRRIDAQTFLRKATDAEFSINNKLTALKKVFLEGWDELDQNKDLLDLLHKDPHAAQSQILEDENAKTISALCWYTLLHIAILEEAVKDVEENSSTGQGNAIARVFNPEYSEYLADIKNLLSDSRQRRGNIYPIHNDVIKNAGDTETTPMMVAAGGSVEYQPLVESGAGDPLQHLKLLARKVDYNDKWTYTDTGLIDSLKSTGVEDIGQYDETARYILFELFMTRLITTAHEPFVTENLHGYYKLRDVKELSQKMRSLILAIHEEEKNSEHYNIVKLIFRTVRESFEEFRR